MKSFHLLLCAALLSAGCSTEETVFQTPDPSDVVMYQINPRVFAPQNSFNAVKEQLESIRDLGANVVWFMPIYPIGEVNTVNSPYCIRDYRGVNPEFGTLEDFKEMVESSHSLGMSVIVDWVANHTSWDSDWLQNEGWYTTDEDGNVISPEGTGWNDVADLNFDNADMRLQMISDMKYWVEEVGVDGFRCDAADYVPFDFWKQAVDTLRSIEGRDLLLLAEGQRPDHFDAGFDMNYSWGWLGALHRVFGGGAPAETFIKADSLEYAVIPEGKIKLRFTTNHDESSKNSPLTDFGGERGSVAAFVATSFIHGGALVYGSQEVGYENPINFFHYVPVDWASKPEFRQEYKDIISIYNSHPAVRKGSLTTYPDDDVLMFARKYEDDEVFVAVNVRPESVTVDNPHGGTLSLEPYQYIIETK